MSCASNELESATRIKAAESVTVASAWFSSAFEVAVGSSIHEALARFSDELRATLNANDSNDRNLSDKECLALVRRIQMRMCVAAEWSERLDSAAESEAAQ